MRDIRPTKHKSAMGKLICVQINMQKYTWHYGNSRSIHGIMGISLTGMSVLTTKVHPLNEDSPRTGCMIMLAQFCTFSRVHESSINQAK